LQQEGFSDVVAVSDGRAAASVARAAAQNEAARARSQIPLVQELDGRIASGQDFLAAVDLVRAKLLDGAFIGELVARRQQALLGIATSIIGEMTNDRFGFSADFEVVDRLSGQLRSPRTLSGGESFLASLSLALAMVELAARAGGRLDALFLDEGFGALDNPSLDLALDALESRAQGGRLVAVISHVRAVAERIPDVLAVARNDIGATSVGWLSETGRAELLDRDLADSVAGLLG
jgi:exonuclease SbcC